MMLFCTYTFVFYSPMVLFMFQGPAERVWDFVIRCKGCHKSIAAPVETVPSQDFVAVCPLCRSKRQYLPTEVFQGRLSYELIRLRSARVRS